MAFKKFADVNNDVVRVDASKIDLGRPDIGQLSQLDSEYYNVKS